MSVQQRSTRMVAWRHLVVGPLAGGAVTLWMFEALVRPVLAGPAWVLDGAAIASGVAGLLIGGAFSFVRRSPISTGARVRYSAAIAGTAAVAVLVVALAGVPAQPALAIAASGGGIALVLLLSRARQGDRNR